MTQAPRIIPAEPPYPPAIEARLASIMPPGVPPLVLFRVLARDERLFSRFMGAGLLDKGHLTPRQREIVIDRATARCGSEYEFGVHAAFFAEKVGLDEIQLASLVHGSGSDACWTAEERVLIEVVDSLHASSDIDDALWSRARAHVTEAALMEILLLAGFYRTVSYLTNALRLPREAFAPGFPAHRGP